MAATRTLILVPSQSLEYVIPGVALSVAQIQTAYASEITGLSTLVGAETFSANGADRIVTFTPRTGTKG